MRQRNGGTRHGRRGGTKGSRINDPNTQRPSKQKRTRQRESKVLLHLLHLLRLKLTCTLQKERVQVESRSSLEVRSGWMSMYEDQAPRTGPYCRRGSLVSNISDPHPAGDPSPVRILWITHPHHGQSQQSRSSRHSSGRARSGSDSTTIRGKPTAVSEFDLFSSHQGGRKCSLQIDDLSKIALS